MTETIFQLFDETTPSEATDKVELHMKPLKTETWLEPDYVTYTAGLLDDTDTFSAVGTDEKTVDEYCVKVEFYLTPVEEESLETIVEKAEIGGGIQSFPEIPEELGEIFSDEVRVFNSDGEVIY
jgi:hypothetical protein